MSRGDVAFARDSLEEALAEYRLAVRQGREDAGTLARVGHTYVRLGRVDEAREFYRRAAREERGMADQAASDFLRLARDAATRNDRFQMASAMDAALAFRPGLSVSEMALPLARHYFRNGEYGRALPFYDKALAAAADSAPELVFEIGQAHEEIGDCEGALVYFERFRTMVRPWERGEVDWYIGTCAFRVAGEVREEARALRRELARQGRLRGWRSERSERLVYGPPGDTAFAERVGGREIDPERQGRPGPSPADTSDPDLLTDSLAPPPGSIAALEYSLEKALRLATRTIEVGEPRNLQGEAWFLKGELLSSLGDCDGALEAFQRVREVEPTTNTALARRALERYDEIRFGRGLQELTSDGRCG